MCIEYYVFSSEILVSKNEQVEKLQSKLEKTDETVKELESIQERKSYVTLQSN